MRRIISAMVITAALYTPSMASVKLGDVPSGLTLLPGDTRIFTLKEGHPVSIREATEQEKPASGELKARFYRNEVGMFLTIENNTHYFLNYRADLKRTPASSEVPTSVCTILNDDRMALEHWPYEIASIRIDEFLPDADQQVICH